MKALSAFPTTLVDMYAELVNRILAQPEEDVDLAKKVLLWLSHSKRPLTGEELEHALSVTSDSDKLDEDMFIDIESAVFVCAGAVVQDEYSRTIRPAHFTLIEYLLSDLRLRRGIGFSDTDLAVTCLTYLEFTVSDSETGPTEQPLTWLMAKYKFAAYAVQFWGAHCRDQLEENQSLQYKILKLFGDDRKRMTFLQIEKHVVDTKEPNSNFPVSTDDTLLHILARHGINIVCQRILRSEPHW